jgi:hypothetical protein
MADTKTLIAHAYAAFNKRDIDGALRPSPTPRAGETEIAADNCLIVHFSGASK